MTGDNIHMIKDLLENKGYTIATLEQSENGVMMFVLVGTSGTLELETAEEQVKNYIINKIKQ